MLSVRRISSLFSSRFSTIKKVKQDMNKPTDWLIVNGIRVSGIRVNGIRVNDIRVNCNDIRVNGIRVIRETKVICDYGETRDIIIFRILFIYLFFCLYIFFLTSVAVVLVVR